MDASNRKASPVGSSAAQPAHDVSDADGETITGDGSHKGEERPQEAAKPKAPPPAAMNCAECGQRCGFPNGAVHWSDEEDPTMRAATCDSEPRNKDYVSHCHACEFEWFKPSPPGNRCPKCQQQVRDGELPEKEKRMVEAGSQTCSTIEHLLDCSLEHLLASPELMMCSF